MSQSQMQFPTQNKETSEASNFQSFQASVCAPYHKWVLWLEALYHCVEISVGSIWDALKNLQIMQKAGSCIGFLFSRGGGVLQMCHPSPKRAYMFL